MTPEQLEAIRQRAEVATPGPWELDEDDGSIEGVMHLIWHGNLNTVARTGEKFSHDDGQFIANARQDIPALLAHIATLAGIISDQRSDSGLYQQGYRDGLAAAVQCVRKMVAQDAPLDLGRADVLSDQPWIAMRQGVRATLKGIRDTLNRLLDAAGEDA